MMNSTYNNIEETGCFLMRRFARHAAGLMLSFALLFLGGTWNMAMGQQYTITSQKDKDFPQENIPTLEETVYVKTGESRDLQIGNYKFYWYFRWYGKEGDKITIDRLSLPSGSNLKLFSDETSPSFFWCRNQQLFDNRESLSKISYKNDNSDFKEDSVFCDLSFYVDGESRVKYDQTRTEFTEPTISKRYKFIIKNANEMIERLSAVGTDEALETFNITVPKGATGVNLQMSMTPENYYWETDNQGSSFQYTIGGDTYSTSDRLITISSAITSETTVEVRASDEDELSPCLAKFILTPQENSRFKTEDLIANDEDRNPRQYPQRYVEIGSVDFDFDSAKGANDGVIDEDELTADNNMGKTPLDWSITTYGFADPMLPWINEPGDMPEDTYGLYRSANVENVSKTNSHGTNWGKEYNHNRLFSEGNKTYGWYYTEMKDADLANRALYDRTYYNTEKDSCGYFYYVNASKEAGRVVTVPIDGVICANTELTVTAWVADITDGEKTVPNVSLMLRGVKEEKDGTVSETAILHRFSSGNMTRDGGDTDRAIWKQLCYRVFISQAELSEYTKFYVEFHNNTRDSEGGDYAIDDIRIYRTKPDVKVERFEACVANTLTINTDYETILHNMGWTAGEEVPTSASRPTRYNQYGYGLPTTTEGDETKHYYGNIYFAFLEGLSEDREGNITTEEKDDATDLNYAVADSMDKDINPRVLSSIGETYRWVRINRNLTSPSYQSVYSFRVIVSTNESDIPISQAAALQKEKEYNIKALLAYNADTDKSTGTADGGDNNGWAYGRTIPDKIDISSTDYSIITDGSTGWLESNEAEAKAYLMDDANYDKYLELIETLYSYMQIPRIRCPWIERDENGNERLYLYEMNVEYTDMMFEGETYEDAAGNIQTATGDYHVMVFSGQQISGYPQPTNVPYSEISGTCSLVSGFTVYGRIIIRIDAEPDVNARACAGSMRRISASLINHEDGTELKTGYSFDWYMGSLEDYYKLTIGDGMSLQDALTTFRNEVSYEDDPYEALKNWEATGENATIKTSLLELVEDNLLVIDATEFDWYVACEQIVAIPFVEGEEPDKLYCFEVQTADVPEYETDVPQLHPGYNMTVSPFEGEVSLRLGHPNMNGTLRLNIPMRTQKDWFKVTGDADALGIPETGVEIRLNRVADDYPIVGKAQQFRIAKYATIANVTITLNEDAKSLLREGQSYELLIPFVQYKGDERMDNECDGQIVLPVKIVPEYLTWKGGSTDSWYDESKWNQSTKGELYFDGWDGENADKDANGPDAEGNYEDITNAYSPLYFTKITIPESSELALSEPLTEEMTYGDKTYDVLKKWSTDGSNSDSIRYEMAVADANGTISPYYINKVEQIYFKPEASLYRQDHLTYEKAWVDFEMKANTPYWMSAPLQDVYAGDMYAPSSNGRQETEVFNKDITYSGEYEGSTTNSRWKPAFYQKAWDKAISYITKEGYTHNVDNATDVAAVKSNWSIEYNDVWVPYSLGKGFYSRVEEVNNTVGEGGTAVAQVRLPKADTKYSYETKALNNPDGKRIERTNNGQMADGQEITITLSDSDDNSEMVDGDGEHFLIGNPYMGYLDMTAFFEANKNVLQKDKFWTLDRDNGSIVVGTPDVTDWGNGKTTGYVAPMTAFFVELKPGLATGANKTVTFKTSMIAQKPTTTENVYTKSYAATNPTLTITAERGETRSVAKLLTSDKAENGYRASEDAVVLLDSELDAPMVYTVAGSRAAQVNAVKKISNIGLGVYNAGDDEATLTISGISRMATPLYLYDAATRQSTRLEGDSYELRVSGDSHGRYFLRDAELGDELENTISIYSARPGEVIVSALQPVKDIRVFALNGAQVRRFSVNTTSYTFTLPAGIYMIQATDGERGQTEKVLVR